MTKQATVSWLCTVCHKEGESTSDDLNINVGMAVMGCYDDHNEKSPECEQEYLRMKLKDII